MACEQRWCFNRGCDGANRRWLYILLLAFCVLQHLDSSVANNELDRYHYGQFGGHSNSEIGPIEFSYVSVEDPSENVQIIDRRRRETDEKSPPTTEQTPKEQQQQQSQEPPQQPQQQQPAVTEHPESPARKPLPKVVELRKSRPNVSYSMESTTESSVASSSRPTAWFVKQEPTTTEKPSDATSLTVESVPLKPSTKNMKSNATDKVAETNKNATNVTESAVTQSTVEKDDSESNIGDISISKFSDVTNKTLSQHNITKTELDTHQYYNSTFIIDEAVGRRYWVDINKHPDLKVNHLLSQSHRRAATVKLKFDFPFYGHKVRNITIATGGFLYTGEYVHSWLAATQYIAPLMANFDTRLSNESYVKYADNGTAFTVVWEKVVLQDIPDAGAFTFQVTLHQNGDIVFVYSMIPLMVEKIEDTAHPVKVGLSDAYIMDRIVFFVRRKTIYEYHRVNFNRQDIKNWTVIYLNALPTCLEMDNCKDCLTKLKDFDCKWCSELNQCSTGTFRSRQDWLLKGCDVRKIKDVNNCPSPTTTYKEHEEDFNHVLHVHSEETVGSDLMNAKQERPGTSPLGRSRDNMNMGVSGIIGILLVIALVVGLAAWAGYAYRNPHSASGQMLIRYRPSQWSWRRGEARYTAATIHM